ncbi:MAG TPA: ParB/RepB/Spo0J family partition protein [Gemmatimonadaceae bacterium]|nr:ParB/RepB/Spo0J family partition protein [Gemmatimonadaceae bacterium]
MPPDKPRRLGRGLEALLATRPPSPTPTVTPAGETSGLQHVRISDIRPNPYQPRKEFRAEELAELEASLRTSGLLQPISVRPAAAGDGYELVAGERRLRAASRIGWTEIPAVVRTLDDRTMLTLALVENLQRADLNPIDEAEGYQRLLSEFSLTQQQVAELIGKDRSTIANTLRLLALPSSVRRMVQAGQLTSGHARALLALGDEARIGDLARMVVAEGLSVRDVEQRARAERSTAQTPPQAQRGRGQQGQTPEIRQIEEQLRHRLQTDIKLVADAQNRGQIRISFYSLDDLDRVLDLVLGARRDPV